MIIDPGADSQSGLKLKAQEGEGCFPKQPESPAPGAPCGRRASLAKNRAHHGAHIIARKAFLQDLAAELHTFVRPTHSPLRNIPAMRKIPPTRGRIAAVKGTKERVKPPALKHGRLYS